MGPQPQSTDAECRRAFALGRLSAQPFTGRMPVATFPSRETLHDSVVAYERTLIEAVSRTHEALHQARLRETYAQEDVDQLQVDTDQLAMHNDRNRLKHLAHWVRGQRAQRSLRIDLQLAAQRLESASQARLLRETDVEWLQEEVLAVRDWLDAWVSHAERYVEQRRSLRRTPKVEPRPDWVVVYSSTEAFLLDDPRRAIDIDTRREAGGADFGTSWEWQDFDHPWVMTKWRVSYIEELGEVYAQQIYPVNEQPYGWLRPADPIDRPVWLLKSAFGLDPDRPISWFSQSEEWHYLGQLQAELSHSRNSLLALCEALEEPDEEQGATPQ